jgi:spore germination protein KB
MFTITFFLQSSALLTAFLSSVAQQDSWIPVVLSTISCMPLVYLFRTLMVMFPEKTLLEMMDEVFGPVIGKIFGVWYLWFFLTLAALNLKDLGDFAKATVMTETPHVVLVLLCALVVVWAVRHGLKVVTRYSALFTFIEFGIVAVTFVLVAHQMDFNNLLPAFQLPPIKYLQGTHLMTMIPVGELVVMLMLTPCVKLSRTAATKYWFIGVTMGMLTLFAILVRDIMILGNTLPMFTLPGLVTMRLVNLGEALSRIEILFAVGLTMLLFFKVAVLCYASTIALAQLFKTKSYKNFALIIGVLVVVYGPIIYSSTVEQSTSARDVIPFFWGVFEVWIPLLMFIIAKIRKLPKKTAENPREQEPQPPPRRRVKEEHMK